jgi:outer membrane protein TolC
VTAAPLLLAAALVADPAATPPAPAAPPLALDQAIATALSRRPSLAASRSQALAAGAQARQARGALLPQVSLSGRLTRTDDHPGTGQPSASGDSLSGSLSADQLLFDFGATPGRAAAAASSAAAAVASARAAERDVALEVRLAWFGLLQAMALERVAQETLANQQGHLSETEERVRLGTAASIDLARLRTAVASARASLLAAGSAVRTARARVDVAMGLPGHPPYDPLAPSVPPLEREDQPARALVEEAARARQDLVALRAEVEARRRQVDVARGALWPSLHLGGSLQGSRAEPAGGGASRRGWSAAAGLSLAWQPFDGLASQAALDAERARLDAAEAALAGAEQALWEEIEDAVAGVDSARAQLPAAEEGLAAARELLGLAEARYREGVGNSLELADAELQLAGAAAQRVQVEYGLAGARARLLRALGRDSWR